MQFFNQKIIRRRSLKLQKNWQYAILKMNCFSLPFSKLVHQHYKSVSDCLFVFFLHLTIQEKVNILCIRGT